MIDKASWGVWVERIMLGCMVLMFGLVILLAAQIFIAKPFLAGALIGFFLLSIPVGWGTETLLGWG